MFFLTTVLSCMPLFFVSDGRTVQSIIGRNVSFSWTFNNTNRNSIRISHNGTYFVVVWPLKNFVAWHTHDERLHIYIENSTYETLTVSISNITEKDAGIYKLELLSSSLDFSDSVFLQIFYGTNRSLITVVRHVILDSSIELQCNSLNISTGNFTWRLNGSLIESNGRYSQNNTILYIQNLTADDRCNIYTCHQSEGGFESDRYRLNISDDMYNIYTCNQSEGVSESDPYRLNICILSKLLGFGLVVLAICFIIVGSLILVTHMRKCAFSRSASGTMHQPSAESSNREVAREMLRFENLDRPITIPIVQDNACQRIGRSGYPVVNRISRSLQAFINHTQDFWNPLRQAVSLQTLQTLTQLSYAIRSQVPSDDSISATCCSRTYSMSSMDVSANGISMDELSSRAQRDSGVSHDEQNTGTRSLSLNNDLRVSSNSLMRINTVL